MIRDGSGIEVPGRFGKVWGRVQTPVGLDELAQGDVVWYRGLPELLAPAPINVELLGVLFPVERARGIPPGLAPTQLPLSVCLPSEVHQARPPSIALSSSR